MEQFLCTGKVTVLEVVLFEKEALSLDLIVQKLQKKKRNQRRNTGILYMMIIRLKKVQIVYFSSFF